MQGKRTLKANDAVIHLRHHGIDAMKYRAVGEDDEVAEVLIEVCRARREPVGDGQLWPLARA